MINVEALKPILAGYKEYFLSHWADEKYKWEAVKHFQDHWNIDAPKSTTTPRPSSSAFEIPQTAFAGNMAYPLLSMAARLPAAPSGWTSRAAGPPATTSTGRMCGRP